MRSRYSAFAKREVEYLYRTLHPEHPDRAQSHDEIVRELRNVAGSHKYPGLKVLDRRLTDEKGTSLVLFHARVFQLGRDLSFVECSSFRHDGTGWRYYAGEALAPGSFSKPIDTLTLADFPTAGAAKES